MVPGLQFIRPMLSMFSALRPGYLVAGAAVAVGLYAVRGAEHHAAPAPAPKPVAVAPQLPIVAPPVLDDEDADDSDEVIDESADEDEIEEDMRGLDAIDDPAEFAMVFSVDGTSYLRLSDEKQAHAHAKLEMVTDTAGVYAAIANVATGAMPAELRSWAGRTVLVDGTCTAHVIGFAEVSRVSGDPPGTEDYYYSQYDENGDRKDPDGPPPEWNAKTIREQNVTLAAKLDGCDGTWARASEYPAAAIAEVGSEPELESEALKDVMETADSEDLEKWWADTGNEGSWKDKISGTAETYVHPLTGEKWIFARVYQEGGCGDFGVSQMSAYHVTANGKLHKVADLSNAGETIQNVVDVDGDGQPELVFGGSGEASLVDLTNTTADSISVPSFTWGCGC